METLKHFKNYALARGYNLTLTDDSVVFRDVQNPGNDFKLMKTGDKYSVVTLRVSPEDYEYAAKCAIYLLLAEYNRDYADSTHDPINFKVEL